MMTTLDTTPPPTNPDYTATTGTQTGRLARNGVSSSCATPKATPALQDSTAGRRYDAYIFTASAAGCITVTLSSTNGATLYSAAYNSAGFVPTNVQTNYLADPGTSGQLTSYSFNVTAGQAFTVVVHEINVGGGNLVPYTLSLGGPVTRNCQILQFEADLTPRPTGDAIYQSTDPSLIEEFLIFAKTPDPSTTEFQRADCAPYNTKGDGVLNATDVNLAEQYLISAVAQQIVGGPTVPVLPPVAEEQNALNLIGGGKSETGVSKAALLPRVVRAGDVSTSAGATVVVPILVDAEGDETGYSFTLDYDPMILTMPVVLAGDVGGTRAFVIGDAPNNGVPRGKITFSLRNFTGGPNGNAIPAGNGQVLVRVQFQVAAGAMAGMTQLTFSGTPTANSVTNANSQPLAAQFNPGTVTIAGATAAGATVAGRVTTADGRGIRGVSVKLTDAEGRIRTAVTTAFGYYRFQNVPAGQTYVVSAKAKRYTFSQPTQVLNLNADDDNVNFTANGL